MKTLLSLIISGALVVSGYSQTRNVLVGTNNAVVQPTNFWSADATNARSGLGLGSAATNPASAFQPSSAILSNLAAGVGSNLTNIAASNIVGTLSIGQGGTGSTNASDGRTALGLGTAATNPASAFQPSSSVLSNLASSNGVNLTNLNASNITGVIPLSNIPTVNLTNIGGTLAITSGGTGATNAGGARTNLGLGWPALTNSNAGTGLVSVDTNGDVVSPTNFWQRAPIQTLVQDLTAVVTTQTNNATNARNLYIYSLATNVSSISNTILLPTNAATFNGDEATVIHKGTTNTTTVVRQAGSTNNLITLSRFDESVKFIRELGQWDFYHNISYVEPIQFSGTNASSNAAASRTNLGLGATNDVTFKSVNYDGELIINNAQITGWSSTIDFEEGRWNYTNYGSVDIFNWGTSNKLIVGLPIEFNNTTNAATTRTNLGLGATNAVTFSALTLSSDLTLGSGDNIVLSTTNGTKIGTATNQLLGFYNQTPITQPSSTGVTTNGFTGGSGANVHPSSTFTGGIGTNAYTISDVVAHLKSLGLIAP